MLAVVMFIVSASASVGGAAEGFVLHETSAIGQTVAVAGLSAAPYTPSEAGLDRQGPAE